MYMYPADRYEELRKQIGPRLAGRITPGKIGESDTDFDKFLKEDKDIMTDFENGNVADANDKIHRLINRLGHHPATEE